MGLIIFLLVILVVGGVVAYRYFEKQQRVSQKQQQRQTESPSRSVSSDDPLWQTVCDERSAFIEETIGKLPDDILKVGHLFGVWPGGGLYQIEAQKLGNDTWVYTSFGLSNPDMPATSSIRNLNVESQEGNATSTKMTLVPKENVPSYPGRPGYGYELMIATRKSEEWPLWILQWVVNAEILNDADLLGRANEYGGLTIEDVSIGAGKAVNLLIYKAESPLPRSIELSNGTAEMLVATTIADDEMKWSMTNGRQELLQLLLQAGIGQISDLERPSVLNPEPLDLSTIEDVESAKAYYDRGLLRKVYLFPLELGGPDAEANIFYAPKAAALQKKAIDSNIAGLAQQGLITGYSAKPEYKGSSFIPAALAIEATGEDRVVSERIEIW